MIGTSRAPRLRRLTVAAGAATLLGVSALAITPQAAHADPFVTTSLSGTLSANDIALDLVGAGVTVDNVSYTGANVAAGRFAGGSGIIDFDSGVLLSSGDVSGVVGPNNQSNKSTSNATPGDATLSAFSGQTTHDAAVLEFDFVPNGDQVFFEYVFSSEEYNEFVGQFNDTFAFFVNGTNCATIGDPAQPVSINTVNNATNSASYIDNGDGTPHLNTQMDGLTVTLTCAATVIPNDVNHIKLAIADAGDSIYDSNVFLKAGSFSTTPPTAHTTGVVYSGALSAQYSDAANLAATLTDTTDSLPIQGATLGFTLGALTPSAGPTDAAGWVSTSTGPIMALPGSISTVDTSFAGATIAGVEYGPSSDSDAFALAKEDCTMSYTGDVDVLPATNTNLRAQLGEPDSSPGDWSAKPVVFTLTDGASVSTTYNALTNGDGLAETNVAIPSGVYGVVASFAGDDYYHACESPRAPDTLLVVQAAGQKVTGGGWFSSPHRTNFGFNLIPEAGGLWKGQIQVRVTNSKSRFHGNTVTSATKLADNSWRWTGTGRWNGETGYTYEVTVVDNGSSGSKKGDTIRLKIYPTGSPGNPVYDSAAAAALKGGNITVHK
ncbi:MAG TPA: choice-of-anchor L domain-containing protein [Acidimicrobiales bacterium]|nr:choice-of-anchor L domain-containing protein [Acidimicrobiales bacterium]